MSPAEVVPLLVSFFCAGTAASVVAQLLKRARS